MRSPMGIRLTAVLGALTVLAAMVAVTPPVLADSESDVFPPTDPPPAETVDPFGASPIDQSALTADPTAPSLATIPRATPAGQNPEPFTGTPPFSTPTVNPSNGAVVGVAKPIIINFAAPITDRPLAEGAIHISSNPPVPGKFYWMNARQVRWQPFDFWPAQTTVNIDPAGSKSSFTTGRR